jgi:Tfp pilus assembly protein PilF
MRPQQACQMTYDGQAEFGALEGGRMLQDRYGNHLSTASAAARDAYVAGIDLYLAADAGVEQSLMKAVEADERFALAHLAIARNRQTFGDGAGARTALARARELESGVSAREQGQIKSLGLLIEGKASEAYKAARAHLAQFPRDAMVAQTCLGVFGLIGFSGQPGREAENLALAEILAPAYGDDWWFLCLLGFARMEAGQVGPAAIAIERSKDLNPRNANMAHYRSHLFYENGETEAGRGYLDEWLDGYSRDGLLQCHLYWHSALWALASGDVQAMWQRIDTGIAPGTTDGPALNVLTDMAAILYRAELAGVTVPRARWAALSDFAAKAFPKPGLAFADVHAALAHAMAGRADALAHIVSEARGPAADMVAVLGQAFGTIAREDWANADRHLTTAMGDHARIGGSRAQRDLIEYAQAGVLLRLGQADTARRLLAMHRPRTATNGVIAGL